MRRLSTWTALIGLFLIIGSNINAAFAQGTAFTYQGRLNSGGSPANGSYDFQFLLFPSSSGGAALAGPATNRAVFVTNGLFTTTVDFGPNVFLGASNWLYISVSPAGTGVFTGLSPFQQVTPVPYALFAGKANVAENLPTNSVGAADLQTTSSPGVGQVLVEEPGGQLGWTNLSIGGGWNLTGNGGTTPGADFVGTTDNNALELHVDGARGWQMQPTGDSPNLIGGASVNYVVGGVQGATIGGGGTITTYGQAYSNSIFAFHGTIGGGLGNTIQGQAYESVIAGGNQNAVQGGASDSSIGGGLQNLIQTNASESVIGGGSRNVAGQANATVSGGYGNVASGPGAFVGGGGYDGTGYGGNTASGGASVVGGGGNNSAGGAHATVGGGSGNIANGAGAFIGGGGFDGTGYGGNTAAGDASVVSGGGNNSAGGFHSTVGGGSANSASGTGSFVGGGGIDGLGTIGGNSASGVGAVVVGGFGNQAVGPSCFVGGGGYEAHGQPVYGNTAEFEASAVVGGLTNTARGLAAFVGAGGNNLASGNYSFVGGGYDNTASGDLAAAPGGQGNSANGSGSFAAGIDATANDNNSFVWGDGSRAAVDQGANTFTILATGGAYFITAPNLNQNFVEVDPGANMQFGTVTRQMLNLYSTTYGIGVQNDDEYFRTADQFYWFQGGLHSDNNGDPGSGGATLMYLNSSGNLYVEGTVYSRGVALTSDRDAKENFAALNAQDVLSRIASLPVTEWNYKKEPATLKHVGPMAQDFHAAFGLNGADDTHISAVDEGGVALAAIQGLNQKLEERSEKLEKENADLKQQLADLKALVQQLAKAGAQTH